MTIAKSAFVPRRIQDHEDTQASKFHHDRRMIGYVRETVEAIKQKHGLTSPWGALDHELTERRFERATIVSIKVVK